MQVWQLKEAFCNNYESVWTLFQIQKTCSVGANKSDFYELLQQHKHMKAKEMSEVWSDILDEGYTQQFEPENTHKIH